MEQSQKNTPNNSKNTFFPPANKRECRHILLVDDDPDILSALLRSFRDNGNKFLSAGSGREALDIMEKNHVDLVISDLRMPHMSGSEFLTHVKGRWPKTIRILLTGYVDLDDIQNMINTGLAHRFVTKPWDIADLRHTVELALQDLSADEESEHSKVELLAGLSHELKNPVSAIVGITKVLNTLKPGANHSAYIRMLDGSGRALLNVVNDFLHFSQVETGKMPVQSADFDLREVVEETTELLAVQAQAKGVEMACFVPSHMPPTVKGDAARIKQVLLNFINNAVKFTDSGEVVVKAEPQFEMDSVFWVHFSVTDTGPGISQEEQAWLFNPFYQATHGTKQIKGGTGLGLAISKRIIESMGGHVGFSSQEGVGSEFWFELPFDKQILNPPAEPKIAFPNKKVLVVEENKSVGKTTTALLKSLEIEATEASDTSDIPSNAASWDLVIVDNKILGTNWQDKIHQLKEKIGQSIPVLITTTHTTPLDPDMLHKEGIKNTLMKPVRYAVLLEHLKDIL